MPPSGDAHRQTVRPDIRAPRQGKRSKGPRRRLRVIAVCTVLVAGGATATWTVQRDDESGNPPSPLESTIDRPAVDRFAPADAVINVKEEFGAAGDGTTDDTVALQTAISAALATGNSTLYFPAGEYKVSAPLEWRRPDGVWSTALTLMGQNRDRTIIRLADSTPRFGDAAAPRAIIVTASKNPDGADGSGNQAFDNFIFDLTIDVGAANPGANAVDYMANNRGAIRNVVLRAPGGSGNVGIAMERRWPGPALLEDVRIDGFDIGLSIANSQYSMTAEDVRLSSQRSAGIVNRGNVLCLRRLRSENTVPAIRSGPSTGLLALVDSDLTGGFPGVPAVENSGEAFLRNVRTDGYSPPILHRGNLIEPDIRSGWSTSALPGSTDSPVLSLNLPIAENPELPAYPVDQWASALAFGARAGDQNDDTSAIQQALDSGKPMVYLGPGQFYLSATLKVPATVRAIVGFEALLNATHGAFEGQSQAAVLDARESSGDVLLLAQLRFQASPGVVNVERSGDRPVALQDIHVSGNPFRGTPGALFLTDVEGGGGPGWTFTGGQQVWARHFNTELRTTKIRNDGADLWILGLKTEKASTVLESTGGARSEVLGGLVYPVDPIPGTVPAFVSTDSVQSLTFATVASEPIRNYQILVSTTRNGGFVLLRSDQADRRGVGSVVALYDDLP